VAFGHMLRRLALFVALLGAAALEIPSCESDTDMHCVGDGQDLSPEGIQSCLEKLESRSDRCSAYLAVMKGCAVDIGAGGICESAHRDGETMPCLIQRVKPEQLTEACAASLPKEELKGLQKFWADGKRPLVIDEIAELNADDKDTYKRWMKKKGGSKSAKDKERAYAIKTQKKEMAVKQVTEAAVAALSKAMGAGEEATAELALKKASAAAREAVDSDMTGTLKPFSKGELAGIAKKALELAKGKQEL